MCGMRDEGKRRKILLLHDNRGYMASSWLGDTKAVDMLLLKNELLKQGFEEVEMKSLHQLTFPSKFAGWYVLYPSSEDFGLFYKSFMEDIFLRIQLDGAILLPKFEYFRAHHNKVFMELYRTRLSEDYQTIKSLCFYNVEDLKELLKNNQMKYPVVIKDAEGSASGGVQMASNENELLTRVKQMGRIRYNDAYYTKRRQICYWLGRMKRHLKKSKLIEMPMARQKMIVQSFIQNLNCDYKVLVFAEKFYLLKRYVRDIDFRASGSGKFEFPERFAETEQKILEYAYQAYVQLETPMLSIDIAFDGINCHMIEFQCVNFGAYTLQYSSCYYKRDNGGVWDKVEKKSVLEEEMANAVKCFVERG